MAILEEKNGVIKAYGSSKSVFRKIFVELDRKVDYSVIRDTIKESIGTGEIVYGRRFANVTIVPASPDPEYVETKIKKQKPVLSVGKINKEFPSVQDAAEFFTKEILVKLSRGDSRPGQVTACRAAIRRSLRTGEEVLGHKFLALTEE